MITKPLLLLLLAILSGIAIQTVQGAAEDHTNCKDGDKWTTNDIIFECYHIGNTVGYKSIGCSSPNGPKGDGDEWTEHNLIYLCSKQGSAYSFKAVACSTGKGKRMKPDESITEGKTEYRCVNNGGSCQMQSRTENSLTCDVNGISHKKGTLWIDGDTQFYCAFSGGKTTYYAYSCVSNGVNTRVGRVGKDSNGKYKKCDYSGNDRMAVTWKDLEKDTCESGGKSRDPYTKWCVNGVRYYCGFRGLKTQVYINGCCLKNGDTSLQLGLFSWQKVGGKYYQCRKGDNGYGAFKVEAYSCNLDGQNYDLGKSTRNGTYWVGCSIDKQGNLIWKRQGCYTPANKYLRKGAAAIDSNDNTKAWYCARDASLGCNLRYATDAEFKYWFAKSKSDWSSGGAGKSGSGAGAEKTKTTKAPTTQAPELGTTAAPAQPTTIHVPTTPTSEPTGAGGAAGLAQTVSFPPNKLTAGPIPTERATNPATTQVPTNPPPTEAPTKPPPTEAPTNPPPTEGPTNPPTQGPTNPPPTEGPTNPPPTEGPTNPPPTEGPTDPPPTEGSTNPPTQGPTNPPRTEGPTNPPTQGPTNPPPTEGPTNPPPTEGPTNPPPTEPPTNPPPTEGPTNPPPTEPPTNPPPTEGPTNPPPTEPPTNPPPTEGPTNPPPTEGPTNPPPTEGPTNPPPTEGPTNPPPTEGPTNPPPTEPPTNPPPTERPTNPPSTKAPTKHSPTPPSHNTTGSPEDCSDMSAVCAFLSNACLPPNYFGGLSFRASFIKGFTSEEELEKFIELENDDFSEDFADDIIDETLQDAKLERKKRSPCDPCLGFLHGFTGPGHHYGHSRHHRGGCPCRSRADYMFPPCRRGVLRCVDTRLPVCEDEECEECSRLKLPMRWIITTACPETCGYCQNNSELSRKPHPRPLLPAKVSKKELIEKIAKKMKEGR